MEAKLYYTAPTDEQFDELKAKALEIWESYEEPYRSEKADYVRTVGNVKDNFMHLVAMFDIFNQRKLAKALSDETKKAVRERMLDGGAPEYIIPF